jgi:hypothetical protein
LKTAAALLVRCSRKKERAVLAQRETTGERLAMERER